MLLLQRHGQREQGVNAFEVGAAAFGVFAQCVSWAAWRSVPAGSTSASVSLSQPKSSRAGTRYRVPRGAGRAHSSTSPAARSKRRVQIKGRPIQRGGVIAVNGLKRADAQAFAFRAASAVVRLFGAQVALNFGVRQLATHPHGARSVWTKPLAWHTTATAV